MHATFNARTRLIEVEMTDDEARALARSDKLECEISMHADDVARLAAHGARAPGATFRVVEVVVRRAPGSLLSFIRGGRR